MQINNKLSDVEEKANLLSEPIDLLQVLSDEIQDLYSAVDQVKAAKTEDEKNAKKMMLAAAVEARINVLETLTSVTSDVLTKRQREILDVVEPKPSKK